MSVTPISAVLVEVLIVEEIAARGRPLSCSELMILLHARASDEAVIRAIGRLLDRGELVSHAGPIPFGRLPVHRFSLPPLVAGLPTPTTPPTEGLNPTSSQPEPEPTKGLFDA